MSLKVFLPKFLVKVVLLSISATLIGAIYVSFYSQVMPALIFDRVSTEAFAWLLLIMSIFLGFCVPLNIAISFCLGFIFLPVGALVINESMKGIPDFNMSLAGLGMSTVIAIVSAIIVLREMRDVEKDREILTGLQIAHRRLKNRDLRIEDARLMSAPEAMRLIWQYQQLNEPDTQIITAQPETAKAG